MSASTDHVVIIGTGFAGIAMAIRLQEAGIDDFTILESEGAVGGTWRDNHYPGAACDVQSHLYSFSFEPNPRWTRMFAMQQEILAYLNHCVDAYGLRPKIRFGANVVRAVFDEKRGEWTLTLQSGETMRARAIVSGCGGLSKPQVPDLPGLASFEGKAFHSARWDHAYALDGKRVAVVGTGASGIQIVPAIAAQTGRLHVFQRTPPWILPKPDRAVGPIERALFARVPLTQEIVRTAIYWKLEARALGFVVDTRLMKFAERQALAYLDARVADPVLREKLTPKYTIGCKRVLMSNDYFETLQRPNVELVTSGIRTFTKRGIVTGDGVERPLDAVILATGFQAAEAAAPFEIRGLGGRELSEAWRGGAEAHLGTTVSGFPNFFMVVGPNTGLGHNSMVFMIESQVAYVLDALKTIRARRLRYVDVNEGVQTRWNTRLHQRLAKTVWQSGCHSWYQTSTGKNTTLWPGFTFEYRLRTRRFDPSEYALAPRAFEPPEEIASLRAAASSPAPSLNGVGAA